MTEMYVYMIIHVSVACSKLLFRVANDCVQASSYANLRGPAGICDVQKVWTVVDENEAVSGISQSTFWTLKNRSLDGRAWISESPQQTFKHLLYVVVLALKVGANQNVTSPFFLDYFTFNSWTWRCMMAWLEHAGNFLLNVHRKTFHLTCLGDGLPPRLFATSKLMALVVSIFRERRGVTIRSRLNKQVFQTSDLIKTQDMLPKLDLHGGRGAQFDKDMRMWRHNASYSDEFYMRVALARIRPKRMPVRWAKFWVFEHWMSYAVL